MSVPRDKADPRRRLSTTSSGFERLQNERTGCAECRYGSLLREGPRRGSPLPERFR